MKNKQDDKNITYQYTEVLVQDSKGYLSPGYICVRIDRPLKNQSVGPFEYYCSVSFCSPDDNFSKIKAREICNQRGEYDSGYGITIVSDEKLPMKDFTYRVFACDWSKTKTNLPNWLLNDEFFWNDTYSFILQQVGNNSLKTNRKIIKILNKLMPTKQKIL